MAGHALSALLLAVLALGVLGRGAAADEDDEHRRLRPGTAGIAGIAELQQRLQQLQPGRLLKLELEAEDGRPVYEVKLLTADGRVVELELDARDLALLGERAGHHKREDGDRAGDPHGPQDD